MSDAHPEVRRVPVMGGEHQVTVKPWTMAQRRELRPLLADLLGKILTLEGEERPGGLELVSIFMFAEDELAQIVRTTVGKELPCEWDDLLWEDLPVLAQAVWDTSIMRGEDGGMAGKIQSALAGAMANRAASPSTNSKNVSLRA